MENEFKNICCVFKNDDQGRCCCNCKYHIELFNHPWNEKYRGSINESTSMYACIVFLEKAILKERKHGICEFHDFTT